MWGNGALVLLASLAVGLARPGSNDREKEIENLEYMLEKEAESHIVFDENGEHIVSTKTFSVLKSSISSVFNISESV